MSVDRMTKLVARAVGLSPQQLLDSFIPGAAEHLAGVLELRNTLFGASIHWDDKAYMTWRYRFGSTCAGRGDCWVLVLKGRLAGMVGTEEVELERGAERIPAWSTMDIAIDPQFEGSGLGSWMNMRLCQAAGCALTIGSNEKSLNMITRTFRRLPNRRSFVMPIRFQRILSKRLGGPALANLIAPFVEGLARLWRWVAFLGATGALELKPLQSFDGDTTDLLQRSVDLSEWTLSRNIEFLNWRLFANPRVRYAVTGAFEGGVLMGYMATMQRGDRDHPSSTVLIDWSIDQTRFRPVFRALCADAVRAAVNQGVGAIEVTAYHPRSEALLHRMGFLPRYKAYDTIAVYSIDDSRLQRLLGSGPWFVTAANTDFDDL